MSSMLETSSAFRQNRGLSVTGEEAEVFSKELELLELQKKKVALEKQKVCGYHSSNHY